MNKFIILNILSVIIILSCEPNKGNHTKTVQPNKIDICDLSKDVTIYGGYITANAKEIVKDKKDSCVLRVLDSLAYYVKQQNSKQCLGLLNDLCNVSDGYVSEAYDEMLASLFETNIHLLVNFIVDEKSENFNLFLIEGLKYKIQAGTDYEQNKKRILGLIEKETPGFDNEKQIYLKKLVNQIQIKMD